METNYKLKVLPNDFIVIEELNDTSLNRSSTSMIHLFKMQKIGISTFDSVIKLAQYLNLDPENIGYSGLKDEDGITTQYITIPLYLSEKEIERINQSLFYSDRSLIKLIYLYPVEQALQIRSLKGNHFILTLRGLDERVLLKAIDKKLYHHKFINYYDTQRFGTPNSQKNSHLVGKHLLNADFQNAIEILRTQNNNLSQQALAFNDTKSQQFFDEMEKRQMLFFYSSYYSYCWNEEVKKILNETTKFCVKTVLREEIIYYFVKKQEELEFFSNSEIILTYNKPIITNGKFTLSTGRRAIVEKTLIEIIDYGADSLEKDKYSLKLKFYLPLGSYATMAVAQLMDSLCLI
jgi:tRNA pseudouridine13 synthase